jgi:RNA ligase
MEQIDFAAVERQISEGYISVQSHPSADLRIFNYTKKAQFDWHWTPETIVCRGLITDLSGNVIARPFQKFFSYEQLNGKVPFEPFEVYEKLDGSLGILYWLDGEPNIATRGSFTSEQALKATQILQEKYDHIKFNKGLTYLFEIIYPANRIVVDYGNIEDLFLLATIETDSGIEHPLPSINMPIVKRYNGITEFKKLLEIQEPNKEGFVVRFASGQRVKLKFEDYKRLHKLLTGINAKYIWEHMSSGADISTLLEQVPDEYYGWVKSIQGNLQMQYLEIETQAKSDFNTVAEIMGGLNTMRLFRKEAAIRFKDYKYPGILFAMLDGKNYTPMIWKMIRPSGEKPFRFDIDA